jgi:flagellar basal body-associated protein FliL
MARKKGIVITTEMLVMIIFIIAAALILFFFWASFEGSAGGPVSSLFYGFMDFLVKFMS